jgi:hypothetical protein
MERASKAAPKKTTAKKTTAKKTVTENVIAAPSPEVLDAIVYQESSQVLNRDAEPNEGFGVGDSMPIYYY